MNSHGHNGTVGPGWRRYVPLAACAVVFATAAPAQADPFVYVASSSGAAVFQYGIGMEGDLSPLAPATVGAGASPASVAVSADGQSVYVTDTGIESTSPASVLQYDVGVEGDGLLSPKDTASVAAGQFPSGIAVSSDNRSVYVGDAAGLTGTIYLYDIGPDGALFPKRGQASVALDSPNQKVISVAESPDRSSVYVASSNPLTQGDGWIYQYDVGLGGVLSPKNPPKVALGNPPGAIAVHPDGKSAYVSLPANDTVGQYNVGADGTLSPMAADPVGTGDQPFWPAVSPDGKSLYVTNGGDMVRGQDPGSVTQYDIDATTRALSPKEPGTVLAGNHPQWVAVSPDGQSVYVSNLGRPGTVSQYSTGGDGTLNPMDTPSLELSDSATAGGLAVSPTLPTPGPDLLVGTAGDNVICGRGGSDTIKGLGGDDKLHGDNCGSGASASSGGLRSGGGARVGHDRLLGGAGRDRLYGGPGKDRLRGGRGRDLLRGEAGRDRLRGGAGRDMLHVRGGGRDRVHCGDGRDTVRVDKRDTVRRCERIIRR